MNDIRKIDEKRFVNESFNIKSLYSYNFEIDGELYNHELIKLGFKGDLIEILLQKFKESLENYIENKIIEDNARK